MDEYKRAVEYLKRKGYGNVGINANRNSVHRPMNDGWYIGSTLEMINVNLTDIDFKFDECLMGFKINNCKVKDLRFLPRKVQRRYQIYNIDVPAYEYRHALLTTLVDVELVDVVRTQYGGLPKTNVEISEILTKGRVNGVMPSELIPGKIKQLKEIDDWWVK